MAQDYINRMGFESGGYPTGRAPLTLDLANPVYALTQQMIKRTEQDYTNQKDEISGNINTMLKSLSFEAVKGMGKQVQQEHLQRIDDLNDKWVNILMTKEGRLSAQDLQNLQFDKQSVEQDIASKKANIERFAKVQDLMTQEMLKPEHERSWDINQTLNNIETNKDMIGGNVNPFGLMVPRKISIDETIERTQGKFLDDRAEAWSEEVDYVDSDGIIHYKKGNKESLDQAADRMASAYTDDQQLSAYDDGTKKEGLKRAVEKRMIETSQFKQQSSSRYNPFGKGGKYEGAMHLMNSITEGLLRRDSTVVELLKKQGNIEDIVFDEPNNRYLITDKQGRVQEKPMPAEGATPEQIILWKNSWYNYLPLNAKDLPAGWQNNTVADYSPYLDPGNIYQPEKDMAYAKMEEMLSMNRVDLEALVKNKGEREKRRDVILKGLQTILKKEDLSTKGKAKFLGFGFDLWFDSTYRITVDVDGQQYEFDLSNFDDSKRLLQFIQGRNKYNGVTSSEELNQISVKNNNKPENGTTTVAPPRTTVAPLSTTTTTAVVPTMTEENKKARQAILGRFNSFDELLDWFMSKYELDEEQAKKALFHDFNLIEKDFN